LGGVSWLLHPEADLSQAYLGHRNIQNTTRYTALTPQRFKEFSGIDAFSALFQIFVLSIERAVPVLSCQ
jgi:hypothetical protein